MSTIFDYTTGSGSSSNNATGDLSNYYKKSQTYSKQELDALLDEIGTGTYTNENKTPSAVGGVPAGTSFDNVRVSDVLDMLLYPYQNPSFSAFNIDGQSSGNFELGYTYPAGNKLFTWSISNPGNLKENSVVLNSESGLPNTGSKSQTVASITKNTAVVILLQLKHKTVIT